MRFPLDSIACRLSQRPPGSAADADEVAQAFKPWLPGVLGMAFSTGGRTDEVAPFQPSWLVYLDVLLNVVTFHEVSAKNRRLAL